MKDKVTILAKTADTLLLPIHYDDAASPENAQKAIKIYESIIELSKDNYNPAKRIAEIQYQQKDYQAALKTLEKFLGPKCGEDILILCGDCEAAMNNIPKALTYYEQAFALPSLPHKRNDAAQHLVKILISLEEYAKAYASVTDLAASAPDLLLAGERIDCQERLMNAQNGFTAADDDLPMRFFNEAGSSSPDIPVPPLPRNEFLACRAAYYRIRGLTPEGLPTWETAMRLGLPWPKSLTGALADQEDEA